MSLDSQTSQTSEFHPPQAGVPSARARSRARASIARGVLAIGAFAVVALVVIVALLSDRAPRYAQRLKSFLLEVGSAFETAFGVDWFDRDSFPGTFDQIGHALLWATGMFVLGLAFRRWVFPLITAGFVMSASVLLEVLQGVVTTSRRVELFDLVANGIGIGIALVVVLLMGLLIDMVTRIIKNTAADPRGARLHRGSSD